MKTSTIEQYVKQKNEWNSIFGKKALSLLVTGDRQRIADMLGSDLSPENLTCDGEVRGSALQQKARFLNRAAEELLSIDSNLVVEY
jgi:hypothetical protein